MSDSLEKFITMQVAELGMDKVYSELVALRKRVDATEQRIAELERGKSQLIYDLAKEKHDSSKFDPAAFPNVGDIVEAVTGIAFSGQRAVTVLDKAKNNFGVLVADDLTYEFQWNPKRFRRVDPRLEGRKRADAAVSKAHNTSLWKHDTN